MAEVALEQALLDGVTYEELANIEDEFDEIDMEIMRKQYELSAPAYAKRAQVLSKIPSFWALVLEQAPFEINKFIQPSDSRIFAESLIGMHLTRPELDSGKANGSPKSLKIRFEFQPNDFFEDTVLEKEFTYRRARDGWSGLISEPVKIHWKKGKDLSEGLTDGAVALFEARKKAGDMMSKSVPEYAALRKKVEHLNGAGTSFFTWFGWVSGRRYIGPEESESAMAEHRVAREARRAGGKVDADDKDIAEDEDADNEQDDEEVEVHEEGEDLAVCFAEEIWPNAIKLFTDAQEQDLNPSDDDFEEAEDDDTMGEDEDEDDVDAGDVDIRALVNANGKKRPGDAEPPSSKKRKQ